MSQDVSDAVPSTVRQLDSPAALSLAHQAEVYEELQTVLRCCEGLMGALGSGRPDAGPVVEALWTTAVLSYRRCFAVVASGSGLTREDVEQAGLEGDVTAWHDVLLRIADHYADPTTNPRERFTVGVSQGADEKANGVALSSARQPDVDDITVRQTGALAYALSGTLDLRMAEQQQSVYESLSTLSPVELRRLPEVQVVAADEVPLAAPAGAEDEDGGAPEDGAGPATS